MKSKSNTMLYCTRNGNFSLSKHILTNSNNLLSVLNQCNIQCIFKNGFNHLLVLTQRSYIVADKIIDVLILGQTFDQYWLQLRALYVTLLPAPAAESDGHLMRRER